MLFIIAILGSQKSKAFGKNQLGVFFALILDVGLLIVVGVNCDANVQSTHSHAINCSPTLR
jgi:hypothetical protein